MVLLEEVNSSNYQECKKIKISPKQEKYLPKGFVSLSNSQLKEHRYESYLIYNEEIVVGFVLVQVDKKGEYFNILLIVIDEKYQDKGFYKETLLVSINYLISQGAPKVGISYPAGDAKLESLYKSVGFVPANLEKDGRVYMNYQN